MSFQIEKKSNYAIIRIKAEKLDTNVAPALKSELVVLNSDGIKNLIIDVSETRYCDSSGLSSILVANRLCRNSGGTFVLTGTQEPVKKLIVISQLDSILNIAANVDEGAAIIAKGPADIAE